MFDFPTQLNFVVDGPTNKVHFRYIPMLPCIVESIQTNSPIFKCRIRARRGNDLQNSIYIRHNYSYILLMWPLKEFENSYIILKFYVYFTHSPTKISKALYKFSKLHVQFTYGLLIFFQCPSHKKFFLSAHAIFILSLFITTTIIIVAAAIATMRGLNLDIYAFKLQFYYI